MGLGNSRGEKPTAVIVGGGFAGRHARRKLLSHGWKVVLIDAKGYFEYTPSNLRAMVQPNHARSILLPHPADTIVGTVVEIRPSDNGEQGGAGGEVVLEAGQRIAFDFCFLATGSHYTAPMKSAALVQASAAARAKEYEEEWARMRSAQTVVVVGGGATGVELAAEVARSFRGGQQKRVLLVSGAARLLPRLPSSAGAYAAKRLQQWGVELLLSRRVTSWSDGLADGTAASGQVVLDDDRVVQADVVYRCLGCRPCAEVHIEGAAPEFSAAGRSGIHVTPTLQVQGMSNVFAIGDCTDASPDKTAFAAELSTEVAVDNALRAHRSLTRRGAAEPLQPFPQGALLCGTREMPVVECVSLFKWDAVLVLNRLVVCGWTAALSKWMIETIQLGRARERVLILWMWALMERAMLLVAACIPHAKLDA